jgi:hypothetical protein
MAIMARKLLIADRVVGRAASPLAARCAHAVLADHNLPPQYNILHYYITKRTPQPDRLPLQSTWYPRKRDLHLALEGILLAHLRD